MQDPFVAKLVKQRDSAQGQVEAIKQLALDGDRGLTESELEAVETYKRDVESIDKQLAAVGTSLAMDDETRSNLALIAPSVQAPAMYRTAGELIYDMLHASEDRDARDRYHGVYKRVAQHMGTEAALTTPVAGDLFGLSVVPSVGPVIKPYDASMPFLAATNPGVIPQSTGGFTRPYVNDAGLDTGVAAQSAQKAELASIAYEIDSDLHKPTTYGGYLNISQQLMRNQAGTLEIIFQQLRERLSRTLEIAAVTEMQLTTGAVDTGPTPTGPDLIGFLYQASANVYAATGQLATWAAMGPAGWQKLGTAVDDTGRPLLPQLNPQNAVGTGAGATSFNLNGPAGLNTVVTHAITDDSIYVGNSMGFESWLYYYPLMGVDEPSVLGRQVAIAADGVFVRPTPTANSVQRVYDAP